MKPANQWAGTGLVSALAASLCCLSPILALLGASTSMAGVISWIEPLRPYLVLLSIIALTFAWRSHLKRKSTVDCACDQKPSFLQSKLFLSIVTGFTIVTLLIPYLPSKVGATAPRTALPLINSTHYTIELTIDGMTCEGCENHVSQSVNELKGIYSIHVSYSHGNAVLTIDSTQVSLAQILEAVESTGYQVLSQTIHDEN